jgi:hypothetical protein
MLCCFCQLWYSSRDVCSIMQQCCSEPNTNVLDSFRCVNGSAVQYIAVPLELIFTMWHIWSPVLHSRPSGLCDRHAAMSLHSTCKVGDGFVHPYLNAEKWHSLHALLNQSFCDKASAADTASTTGCGTAAIRAAALQHRCFSEHTAVEV